MNRRPLVELAPLPALAQFLNVIESVFNGMARSIIHGSNYSSKDAAINAINLYFAERTTKTSAKARVGLVTKFGARSGALASFQVPRTAKTLHIAEDTVVNKPYR